ncbi:MAG TPA: protoporphyrinogen oxidase [Candidatus Binataceae bacterium]|nr:protoporphyrinogen oxidase [Candidatus Binataceae bacterium]
MSANDAASRIVVIGGGISGLSAAFRVLELAAKDRRLINLTLLERGMRLGGPLWTLREHGLIAEAGADSFLTEKPWARDLARRLNLESELVGTREQFRRTYVVRGGRLTEIPEGFSLLAPARLGPVFRSPLLSAKGKLRLALEPLIPRRRAPGDESLACFVRRRLGREVLERIAQPLAGGIYTADPERLSLHATLPRFAEMERRYGSVIIGLRKAARGQGLSARGTSGARWSLFQTFRGGIQTLVDALARRLGESVRQGVEAVALERGDGAARWRVVTTDGARLDADAVVLALPAPGAARLLAPHSAELARGLGRIEYASAAVVNLAYRESEFPAAPQSFGFVVPSVERRNIIAASFTSLKFAGRAPAGTLLVRVFLGGALQREMMALDDAAMVETAGAELRALLGVRAKPMWTHVARWPDSMPQYTVGHRERAAAIERAAAALPALALCGAALDGVGIPDCIASGERAAQRVFATPGATPR